MYNHGYDCEHDYEWPNNSGNPRSSWEDYHYTSEDYYHDIHDDYTHDFVDLDDDF